MALYRFILATLAIFAGYAAAVGFACFFAEATASEVCRQYLASGYGHFLLLLYLAFGLPHLVVRPVAALRTTFQRAVLGGAAIGLSIAGGISLLFVSLDHGGGSLPFVLRNLFFGAVVGVVAVTLFRLLARREEIAPPEPGSEAPTAKRIAVSLASLAAGCGAPCVLLFLGSVLFDRRDSPARWLPLDRFLIVFSLAGWFLFGLPILVTGPLRHRFTRPLASAFAGGAGAIVLVESYNRTMFATDFTAQSFAFDAVFSAVAFLIGALTTYLYVRYREKR